MPVDPKEGLYTHEEFRGLRNNVAADGFELGDLSVALNVDIDDGLGLQRRSGYSAPVVAGVDRDLWASGATCLGVGSNALKQIFPDYSTRTLRSGLTALRPLSYVDMGSRVYYANGVENGCIDDGVNRTWGIAVPPPPTLAAASGNLRAGKYQVAVMYLREDAQESGVGRASTIELTATGGISLPSVPVSSDSTVTYKVICATSVGGETLYWVGVIPNATTTYTITDVQKDAKPVETQFWGPPPVGNYVGRVGARLLVAVGSRLYPSEPYAPELFDLRKGIPFSSAITMLESVTHKVDGCWVGTADNVIWLRGADPESWEYGVVADYGVLPGTLSYIDGEAVGDGAFKGDRVAFFATTRGLCTGTPGGGFTNLTESRFAYPIQERGAGVVRRHRGMLQYVATLGGSETAGNVAS